MAVLLKITFCKQLNPNTMCRKTPCFFVPFVLSFTLFMFSYLGIVPVVFYTLSLTVIAITVAVWVKEFSALATTELDIKNQVLAEDARFVYVLSSLSFLSFLICLYMIIDKTYGSPIQLMTIAESVDIEFIYTISIILFLIFLGGVIICKKAYRKLQ